MLFTGIEDRYRPVYRDVASLEGALARDESGERLLVHVHWEEFVLRDCIGEADAEDAADAFIDLVARLVGRGVPIVWTIHNELPHIIRFDRTFLAMRRRLATYASAVLVHNAASLAVLRAQVDLDESRVHVLDHPSYLDRYEDERALRTGLAAPFERVIATFGWVRSQKGFGDMLAMLSPSYLRARGARVRISGEGVEAAALVERFADRRDVEWDLRHVPAAEVPALLRRAACVVLPYDRVLTSGVALLAMSVGVPIVAVDIPQLRELLSPQSRPFLYARGDGDAFRRSIDDVLALSASDRRAIVEANLRIARDLHPTIVARRLARIYDDLLKVGDARKGEVLYLRGGHDHVVGIAPATN